MPTGGNTVGNVSVGKPKVSGAVFCAPLNTTLPTDATSALDPAFKCLGYVSDDGLTNSRSMDINKIKAWGGDVVYSSLTEFDDPFKLTLIESKNADVLKAVFGSNNVTVTAATQSTPEKISINVKSSLPDEMAWVFDIATRNSGVRRIVIPDGGITEIGEVAYTDEDAIGYEITITPYPDSNGIYHKEYIE